MFNVVGSMVFYVVGFINFNKNFNCCKIVIIVLYLDKGIMFWRLSWLLIYFVLRVYYKLFVCFYKCLVEDYNLFVID